MDIRIQPSTLSGKLEIPSSKSYAHRALICAALADGVSEIKGISFSKDIEATISAMNALGAEISTDNSGKVIVNGISSTPKGNVIDCNESGSTLRFIIPIAAALNANAEFHGRGRLPERPIDIFTRELGKKGSSFSNNGKLPFVLSGQLHSGIFEIEGNVSSQLVTGLLFALPLLKGDSTVRITSKLESKPYVDITIECLRKYGIEITENLNEYIIKGSQRYKPCNLTVEGDYSQAAFYYVANYLGAEIDLSNLNPDSVQGDKKILDIISEICYNDNKSFHVDCSDIPDLVPILAVLGSFGKSESVIFNAQRLRIKESDRLVAISETLNKLGGNITVTDDGLIIKPVKVLHAGTVESFGDHRIVMAASIAALKADGDIIIKGAEAVEKSYPDFFRDYNNLGGKSNVIILE